MNNNLISLKEAFHKAFMLDTITAVKEQNKSIVINGSNRVSNITLGNSTLANINQVYDKVLPVTDIDVHSSGKITTFNIKNNDTLLYTIDINYPTPYILVDFK